MAEEPRFVSFDSRVSVYSEIWEQIRRFNMAMHDRRYMDAQDTLENWYGIVHVYMDAEDEKEFQHLTRFLARVNAERSAYRWNDFRERWTAPGRTHDEFLRLTVEHKLLLRRASKLLFLTMEKRKMMLPEKKIAVSGREMRGARYG